MKNLVNTRFLHSRGLCRNAAQTSADRIGETRSGLSPRGAALASGKGGRVKKYSKTAAVLCLLLCIVILAGCGRSLIITTGFRRGEVFRIGSTGCKIGEMRVYLLDLQKQHEALFGDAIWESSDREELQEAVREQALSQTTRVKALNEMGVKRNVMLTNEEERLAEEAEHNFYASLSDAEIKYIGLDEKNLQRMYREYALADKTWKSLGDSAEQAFQDFYEKTQCDLNTRYWQKIKLKKVEGDLAAPGFSACYQALFAQPAPDDKQASTQDGAQDSAQGGTQDGAQNETSQETDAAQ